MCSTPYGNQRKITGAGPGEDPPAQCAQRLTAIRGKSRPVPRGGGLFKEVLNALRQSEENHQRIGARSYFGSGCSTPYGNQRKITYTIPPDPPPDPPVLNALRQSEENHDLVGCQSCCRAGCSTPYGNQRKITLWAQEHGIHHARCSTPYGNQRKITCGGGQRQSARDLRAQRLTAIRGKSQQSMTVNSAESAFRAQRLTAIRGKSLVVCPEIAKLLEVLNALRQSEENHKGK